MILEEYDASSIIILEPEQAIERWFWAKAGALAIQYARPEAWISRGLQACERAGIPHDFFIDKYLRKLPIPKHDGVSEAMREILLEIRDGQTVAEGGSSRSKKPR